MKSDALIGLIALFAVTVIVAALLFGAPVVNSGGLSWDNTTSLARIQAKQRVDLAKLDAEREAGERWAVTLRWLVVVGGVVAVVYVAAQTHRHAADKRAEVQLAALPLLAQRPDRYLDQVDGEWWVVDPTEEVLIPVQRRLRG